MKNPKSKTPVDPCETEPKQAWRPPPWAWLGDDCCAYMSITILALISPLMAVLIGSSEVTWAIWLKIKKHVDFSPVGSVVRTISEWVGKRILKDPRNSPYLPVLLWLGVYPSLLFSWAVYRYSKNGLEVWFVFLYHFLRIGPRFRCFAYFHVLAHKEGHDHKGFFLPPFQSLNFTYVQWFVALFYGAIPNSYAVGHNKIHHRYSNGLDDVHTCYDLDRTDPWSFLLYLPRFAAYWTGFSVFWHFMSRKEYRFAGRMLAGMVYFYGIIILVGKFFGWDFAFAFLLFPVCEAVVFFGAISYLWHSFLDGDNLDCEYVNSVTIIEGQDNIYNEDFHVVHHLPGSDQNIHWTEYPGHYEKNIEDYKKYQATVFRDCEEGMMLYWMFSKQWDVLAEHYVDLNGKMNHEEKKAHVLKRLSTIMPPPAQELKCKSQ